MPSKVVSFGHYYSYGYNGQGNYPNNIKAQVETYNGSATVDTRPTKPSPLTPTNLTGSRYSANGNFNYRFADKRGHAFFCFSTLSWSQQSSDNGANGGAQASKVRALSRFNSGSWDAAQTLGELHKTISSTSKDVTKIADMLHNVALGNIPGVEKTIGRNLSRAERRAMNASKPERVASMWLKLQYNYLQTARDIHDAISVYAKGIQSRGDVVRSSSGKRPKRRGPQGQSSYSTPTYQKPGEEQRFADTSDGALGKLGNAYSTVRGTVTNPNVALLERLSLLNPVLLAWNLLPYSFIADWVLDVGDIFASLTRGLGFSPLLVSTNTESRIVYTWSNGVWAKTYESFARSTALSTVPTTAGVYHHLQAAVHSAHAPLANATALLVQAHQRSLR